MINGKPSLLLSQYTNLQNNPLLRGGSAQQQAANAAGGSAARQSGSVNVTLSEAAKAGLAENSFAKVTEDALANMKKLLADAGKSSPLKDGKLDVDLSRFDRRELFAVATNGGQKFTEDQQKAAKLELQRRFDVTLAGGLAVVGVTGNVKELYDLALDFLNSAGPEERASGPFQKQLAAVKEALTQLKADPKEVPKGIANDPVDSYLLRASKGEAVTERKFADVANDARRMLDNQHKAAAAAGKTLIFGQAQAGGVTADFSRFGNRALSAITLNTGGRFSADEVQGAKDELKGRVGKSVQEAFRTTGPSSDATGFTKNLISHYQTMSPEEREASGLTSEYYATLLRNYDSSQAISNMLAAAGASGTSGSSLNLMSFL